ncbi:MAG: polyprenyl synthetase family protein [Campylobacterales bacterium]|nr:polyprenyl synthetase family protein [Campylobacterales bacterium]
MEQVDNLINKFIADVNEQRVTNLYNSQAQGKRVRAKLSMIIGDNKEESIKLASIIEMIHLASLLHDDVIDDADTRRGKPSVNDMEGSKVAIMVGDIFYSKAFHELTKLGEDVSGIVSNSVVKLSKGEMQDVFLGREFNQDPSKYEEMIYLKTASLIEATCEAAAILANKDREKYRVFGKNLGLAFQIIDDILDITQSDEVLGKPAFHDFKEGKTTLPYIYLYESFDEGNREKLKSFFLKDLSDEEKAWIKEEMIKTGALEKTKQQALDLADEAREMVRDNPMLLAIIDKVVDREY